MKGKFQNKCNIYFKDIDDLKIFLEMRLSYFIIEFLRLLLNSLSMAIYNKSWLKWQTLFIRVFSI